MKLSVVIPVYNEAATLEELHRRLSKVLEGFGLEYEVIIVDDGSADDSFETLSRLQARDGRLRVIRLRRNFGQTAALSAGFDHAKGSVVITMDADLQNPPEEIPKLLAKLEEGFDVVSGWRVKRKDPFLTRRFPSKVANWVISKITGVALHDYGCSLKVYRREVVENLHLYGEMHRFIPAIASWYGVKIAEVKVDHQPRRQGRSKYGLSRTFRVVFDLLTVKFLMDYSTRPLQIFGLIGGLFSGAGFILGVYLSILKIFYHQSIGQRPLLLLSVLFIFLGVQLVVMGLLGELQTRTYFESSGKKVYVVKETLG